MSPPVRALAVLVLATICAGARAAEDVDRILSDFGERAAKAKNAYQGELGKATQDAVKALERLALRPPRKGETPAVAWRAILQLERKHVEARRYFAALGQLDAVLKELDEADASDGLGNPVLTGGSGAGLAATAIWNCADDLDVYQDGKALRVVAPDFRTRPDEAHQELSAPLTFKRGSVLAVAGRRGGSCGFVLVIVDQGKKVLWKSDAAHWRTFTPAEPATWFMPETIQRSKSAMVTVVAEPWTMQKAIQARFTPAPEAIWVGAEPTGYFYSIIE